MPIKQKQSLRVICPDYQPIEGERKCTNLDNKLCKLSDHPVCEVWLKNNPKWNTPVKAVEDNPEYRSAVLEGRWFVGDWRGRARGMMETGVLPASTAVSEGFSGDADADHPPGPAGERGRMRASGEGRGLRVDSEVDGFRFPTEEEIRSWRELRCQVRMRLSDGSEAWLVPEYTGEEGRIEMTPEDAMSVARLASAFPGATLGGIEMLAVNRGDGDDGRDGEDGGAEAVQE